MRGKLEENAFVWLPGDDGIGLKDVLRSFEDKVCFGFGLVVAGEAIGAEEGKNLVLEIDGLGATDFGDGQGALLGGISTLGQEGRCDDREQGFGLLHFVVPHF